MIIFRHQGYFKITIDTGIDLSSADIHEIVYIKPHLSTGTYEATVVGTGSTQLEYQFTNDDLDQIGIWSFQAHVEIGGLDSWGSPILQMVDPRLEDSTVTAIPFRDIIANEVPSNLSIADSFVDINSYKWRTILLSRPNADLALAKVDDPSTWPILYSFLIAKLVIYDLLLMGLKGSVGGDGVKKIETGPSNVEFFDPIGFLKAYGGQEAMNGLQSDICSIASSLRLYLLICGPRVVPIVPQKQGLPCPPGLTQLLSKYY